MAALSFEADILSEDALSEENKKLNLEDLEFNAEIFDSMEDILTERYELMKLDESILENLKASNSNIQFGCDDGHNLTIDNDTKKQAMIKGIQRQLTVKKAENLPYWLRKFKRENKIMGLIIMHLFLFLTCRWVPKFKKSLHRIKASVKEYLGLSDKLNISMTSEQIEEALMKKLKESYCKTSLNFFERENSIRRLSIRILEHTLFDKFIILLIFFNSMFLGMMDYTWKEDDEPQ